MSLEVEPRSDTTVVESDEGSPPFTEDDRRSRPALQDDHSTGGREESKLVEGDGDVGDDPDFHEISYEHEDLMREERARERLRDERAQVDWKRRQAQPSGCYEMFCGAWRALGIAFWYSVLGMQQHS